MYDTIIIGGGPAGVAAAVYTARKKMKTLLIAESFGGQSIVAAEIENWIGTPKISGIELAQNLEKHLRAQEDVEIKTGEKATKIEEKGKFFKVLTENQEYEAKTVILCSGARRRKLQVTGEEKFSGKGVVYCSTCDAPLFRDKKVAVVGAGNAGLEAVEDLLPYASHVYLLTHGDKLRGDKVTIEKIQKADKFEQIIYNAEVKEIQGDVFVEKLIYTDKESKQEKKLEIDGVFVEIGSVPNSEIIKGLVDINGRGEVVLDHKTSAASKPGIFAAGDVTDEPYKQNNISAGDGVKAALSAYDYIKRKGIYENMCY
ncbi:MAG: FAD-dependent oxidoreductase [Candidatus Kuenenbacteria bacterium]